MELEGPGPAGDPEPPGPRLCHQREDRRGDSDARRQAEAPDGRHLLEGLKLLGLLQRLTGNCGRASGQRKRRQAKVMIASSK